MAKKNKDQEPSASLATVSNRDIIQRINFLYQASTYLSSISARPATLEPQHSAYQPCSCGTPSCIAVTPAATVAKLERRRKRRTMRHPASAADLSRCYVKSMHLVGKKTTVKMDPAIKRTICKGCFSVLIPGSTATVRVKPLPSHGHCVTYTCTTCNTVRSIPAPPLLDSAAALQGATAMDVDPVGGGVAASREAGPSKPRKPRRKRPVPREPPWFEREGVHVVFRGDEKIDR